MLENEILVIKDSDGISHNIATKEYVEYLTKDLNRSLNETVKNEVDLVPKKYPASQLEEDSNHRTISDRLIEYFKSKPSLHEINELISDSKQELEMKFNESLFNLINMKDAIVKLKAISDMVSSNENYSNIIDSLTNFVTSESFKNHTTNNNIHLTESDKEMLNLFRKLIDDKLIDRILDSHVKKANLALDSKLLNGMDPSDIIHRHHGILIGSSDNYTTSQVDGILSSRENNDSKYFNNGLYTLTDGVFKFHDLNINNTENTSIIGEYDLTKILLSGDKNIISNCVIRNLSNNSDNYDTTIDVGNNCKICDVKFKKCLIKLSGSEIIFRNCTFDECVFKLNRCGYNIIITENFFINSSIPSYIGDNFITKNNIKL